MGEADDPYKILDTLFEQGGNFIDTANVYQGEESEKTIGDWMEKRGNRDQMVIATKSVQHSGPTPETRSQYRRTWWGIRERVCRSQ